jgi:hypothetical protein
MKCSIKYAGFDAPDFIDEFQRVEALAGVFLIARAYFLIRLGRSRASMFLWLIAS